MNNSLRILITDPDWQLLNQAFAVSQHEGYDLLAESNPSAAMKLARRWLPHVIITSIPCAASWVQQHTDIYHDLRQTCSIIVTASADEAESLHAWARDGYEVLLKPLVASLELTTAIVAAVSGEWSRAAR